ncbi:hypothetical protein HOG98_01215 [bacterium]|nr:hypothetical protein [bacterium]
MSDFDDKGQLKQDVAEKHLTKHAAKRKKRKKKKTQAKWRQNCPELFKKDMNKHYQTGRMDEEIAKQLASSETEKKPKKNRRHKKRKPREEKPETSSEQAPKAVA